MRSATGDWAPPGTNRPVTANRRTLRTLDVVPGSGAAQLSGCPATAHLGRPATAGPSARLGFAAALRAQMAAPAETVEGESEVLWRREPDGEIFEAKELREEEEAALKEEKRAQDPGGIEERRQELVARSQKVPEGGGWRRPC